MLSVKHIMTPDLISVTPELTLRNLVELLAREHISGAPVLEGHRVVGVISADDVLSFLASEPVVPAEREMDTVTEEMSLVDEWKEGDEAPGAFFLDIWADAGADVAERLSAVESPEWDLLGEHAVAEAMSRRVFRIGPDESVGAAARLMERAGVHRLLVMDDDNLLGLVSTTDIMQAVAEGRLASTGQV